MKKNQVHLNMDRYYIRGNDMFSKNQLENLEENKNTQTGDVCHRK